MPKLALAGLLMVLSLLALTTGFRPLYYLLYSALTIVALGYLWAWVQGLGLKVTVESLSTHPQVGQPLRVRVSVSDNLSLPRFALHLSLVNPANGKEEVVSLAPKESVDLTWTTIGHRRGMNAIGPLLMTASDPLGLISLTRRIGEPQNVVVYPSTVPIPQGSSLVAYFPSGPGSEEGRLVGAGSSASKVRQFMPGDSLSRIHWPSTARLDQLMAKEFENDGYSDVWIFLDLQSVTQEGAGTDSTEEYIITLAASLARSLHLAGQPFGLVMEGDTLHRIAPQRGAEHLWKMMEALALVKAQGKTPLPTLLEREGSGIGAGSIAVVIAPWQGQEMARLLQPVYRRSATPLPILLDANSFGGRPDIEWLRNVRGQIREQACVVYRGDNPALALGEAVSRLGY